MRINPLKHKIPDIMINLVFKGLHVRDHVAEVR